jgi:predicted regulator of Ras-like GTPase activity (Roadblock/LC7/MglB family)
MANNEHMNDILRELNNNPWIVTSMVISKSGLHIAGQPPSGAHLETFAAMSAVLVGASESVSSGLKGEMKNVHVEMDRSRIIIESVNNREVLVVVTDTKVNPDSLHEQVKKAISELLGLL